MNGRDDTKAEPATNFFQKQARRTDIRVIMAYFRAGQAAQIRNFLQLKRNTDAATSFRREQPASSFLSSATSATCHNTDMNESGLPQSAVALGASIYVERFDGAACDADHRF